MKSQLTDKMKLSLWKSQLTDKMKLSLRKSHLTDKIMRNFFQAAVVSILLDGYTTWTLTKRIEKKDWRQLHKNAASNIEQVLETASNKTATVRPPTTRHENYQR